MYTYYYSTMTLFKKKKKTFFAKMSDPKGRDQNKDDPDVKRPSLLSTLASHAMPMHPLWPWGSLDPALHLDWPGTLIQTL